MGRSKIEEVYQIEKDRCLHYESRCCKYEKTSREYERAKQKYLHHKKQVELYQQLLKNQKT